MPRRITHLGTFTARNYHAPQPTHSMAHALTSGAIMAGFLAVAFAWLASL